MNLSPIFAHLTRQQIGQYAEYYIKMAFTLHDFDVSTAEVDDNGIDFVIRKVTGENFTTKKVKGM
jgi:hypothetical protein